jgi:transcriptional regulator with XRE-family HTH domain
VRTPEVGKRIRAVRQRLNLTQAEFGKRLGVKKLSVVRYEAGAVSRLDVLRKIAHVGGVTLAWLLEGGEPPMLHETHPTADEQHVPGPLNSLLDRIRTELTSHRLAQLPPSRRTRYEERAKEVLTWAQRELEEYRALLRPDSHTLRTRRRR